MRLTESKIAARYYSRFGIEATKDQLDAISNDLSNRLADAASHQEEQDAMDAILDEMEAVEDGH